jgi:hypothetical protein
VVRLNPDLPADLERIIDKALEFDPRHPHAGEFLAGAYWKKAISTALSLAALY